MADTTNQTKKILTFFLALLIVFAASFLYFKFVGKSPEKPQINPADLLAEQKKQDQATMEKTADLVKAKDTAQCDSVDKIVNGVNYKTVCLNNIYYNMSADDLDYSACEKLVDMSIDDCQRRVMLLSLSKQQSLTVCDKVPEKLKSSCPDAYWNFSAVNQKDPSLCVKTSAPETNLGCQNNVLFSLVSQKETAIACSSFSGKTVKEDCENYLKGGDNCALIKNSLLKGACLK